jgi:ATP-dependent Clp protease ATP-binding subunit ClpX
MDKEYSTLFSKFIKVSELLDKWKIDKNQNMHLEVNQSDTHSLSKVKKKIETQLSEIEEMIESLTNQQKDYPIIKLIKKHQLDNIERAILYYAVGRQFLNQPIEPIVVINFFTDNTPEEFPQLKFKYLEESSKLVTGKILFPEGRNSFFDNKLYRFYSHSYRNICGLKTDQQQNIEDNEEEISEDTNISNILSPKQIYSILNQWVIGQQKAKEVLSVAAYKHYLSIKNPTTEIKTGNVLLIGPTGVGKTFLVRVLAKYLKVPIVFTSANEYSETGYVGRSVNDMIIDLYEKAGKNQFKAEHGIIFIDEIDKIAAHGSGYGDYGTRDVSGRSVQEELLDLLDTKGPKLYTTNHGFDERKALLDASKILFIAAGAFDNLDNIIKHRIGRTHIGFSQQTSKDVFEKKEASLLITDLEQYGFIPEFLGRFSNIVVLSELTVDDLFHIMKDSKDSILLEYQRLFRMFGTELHITDNKLREIAYEAKELGTGARGLRSIMEKNLEKFLFNINEENMNIPKKIVIDTQQVKEISISG